MNKLLQIALNEYGVTEEPGLVHNPRIVQYFDDIGYDWVDDDETAWCSAFMNWCALQAGVERSNKLNARSWLSVGTPVKEPQLGDVVVFWRSSPESWKGHVAIFISKDKKGNIYVLGGNQSNQVNIKPYSATRLLGYRRLKPVQATLEDTLRNAIAAKYQPSTQEGTGSLRTAQMIMSEIDVPTGLGLDSIVQAMGRMGFEHKQLKGNDSITHAWLVEEINPKTA